MKKIFTTITAILFLGSVFAQLPEKMSYQAVVRNAGNNLVSNTLVGMQISILQGSAIGSAVYVEDQAPTTNLNGLVSIEIGAGSVVFGSFSTIDWSTGIYFIKTEIDPTGGTNYTITGTTQLLSVPYALHSKTAESITGPITEIDPAFIASPAQGITGSDITNWNSKLSTEVDGSITNEIQDLLLIGNILSITGAASIVDLSPYLDNTDTQLTEAEVDSFVANNGYLSSFTEIDGSVTNEIQTISRSGLTVTLSNGGGSYQDSIGTYSAGTSIDITNNVISLNESNLANGSTYSQVLINDTLGYTPSFTAFPDLTTTLNLTKPTDVLMSYRLVMGSNTSVSIGNWFSLRVYIDGNPQEISYYLTSISGEYFTANNTCIISVGAGLHTIELRYRTDCASCYNFSGRNFSVKALK